MSVYVYGVFWVHLFPPAPRPLQITDPFYCAPTSQDCVPVFLKAVRNTSLQAVKGNQKAKADKDEDEDDKDFQHLMMVLFYRHMHA